MTTDELREKFEAWYWNQYGFQAIDMHVLFVTKKNGEYVIRDVQIAWQGYQAAHESLQGEIDALRKAKLWIKKALFYIKEAESWAELEGEDSQHDLTQLTLLIVKAEELLATETSEAIDQAIAKGE